MATPHGSDLLAETASGRVRGVGHRGVAAFRGIPYAAAVSSPDRRFKAPEPPEPWAGVREAATYGPASLQPSGPQLFGPYGADRPPAEDCLNLNVWTPAADGERRPVLFYSHGGAFSTNSGNSEWVDGGNLAREHDVVVVTHNHRLGAMGYLYLGELLGSEYGGNQGLLDIVAALAWVNENILAFGGDPENVTIFGESGGGDKTMALYGMPMAAPYFSKASIESFFWPDTLTRDRASEIAIEAMEGLGLTDPRQFLTLPPERLLDYQVSAETGSGQEIQQGAAGSARFLFWPFVGGDVLPVMPFLDGAPAISADKPLLVGSTKDEAVFMHLGDLRAFSLSDHELHERVAALVGEHASNWIGAFRRSRPQASPSQLFIAIETAVLFRSGHVRVAEQKAAQLGANVYSWLMTYHASTFVPGTGFELGAPHSWDILTKFDNVAPEPYEPTGTIVDLFEDANPRRRATAANMSAMWAAFARTGDPSIPGQPVWSPYTVSDRATMLIDADCVVASDPESEERAYWQGASRVRT